jgi:hypothetical protein
VLNYLDKIQLFNGQCEAKMHIFLASRILCDE